MKKRSLVAAVAMLLVSALVLTSATFAWFAKGKTATVGELQAKCVNSDGALLVAAQNSDEFFKTSIDYNDFHLANSALVGGQVEGVQQYNQLDPVDIKFASNHKGDPTILGCNYNGTTFTPNATPGKYLEYTFYIKAVGNDQVIDLKPSWNAGTSAAPYVYGAIKCDGMADATQWYIFGQSSRTYTPFDSGSWTKAVEQTGQAPNGIVDAGDTITGTALASYTITPDNPAAGTFQFTATADTAYTVSVLIWAEGQDAACTGSASNTGAYFSFAPEIVTT
jgi:hypothetical protein